MKCFIRDDWSWQKVLNTFSGKAGWDVPTQDQKGHWKSSGQVPSWKPPCFFRETQIIKEYILLGSSVMCIYWNLYCSLGSTENICLNLVSMCLSALFNVQSHQCPQCNWKFTLICVGTRGLFSEFKASYKQLKLVARIPINIQRNYKILLSKAGINGMFSTITCNSR